MKNRLYNKLFFAGLVALEAASVHAQIQNNINLWYEPVKMQPLPSFNILSEPPSLPNHFNRQQTGNKPTAIRQRETGYFITNMDGDGNIMSQDSGANFMYSGSRGTIPDNSDMPVPFSSYDSYSQYEYTDNFSAEKYKLTQEFNSADLILNGHKHNNTTNQDDVLLTAEYYTDNNTLKQSNLMSYGDEAHSAYSYRHNEYNSSGKIIADSLMQYTPANPNTYYYDAKKYDYDGQGRETHYWEKVDLVANPTGSFDYYTYDIFYFYNGTDNLCYKDSVYSYQVLSNGNALPIYYIDNYTYNSSNQLTEIDRIVYVNGTNPYTAYKYFYEYGNNGNIIQELILLVDNNNEQNYEKINYEYTNALLSQRTDSFWINNEWQLDTKEIYTINNQLLVSQYEKYVGQHELYNISGVPSAGVLIRKTNCSYNDYKNLDHKEDSSYTISINGSDYNVVSTGITVAQYYYTTYDDGTAVNSINKNNISATIYPNPAVGIFTISIPVEALKNDLVFTVYDIEGRLVKRDNIQQQNTTVDISSVSSGIYLLKISDKDDSKHYNQHIVIK